MKKPEPAPRKAKLTIRCTAYELVTCKACSGRGWVPGGLFFNNEACPTCKGSKVIKAPGKR